MTTKAPSRPIRRSTSAAILAVGGGALAVATWFGGAHTLALVLVGIYVVLTVGAWLWSGRDTDVGAIMRGGGDERQRRIDRDATALSGLAMGIAAVIGAIVSAALDEGSIGPWGAIAGIGGITYAVSLAVLQRRG
jgi:hypothetical protein